MKTIVVATDFPERSDRAIRRAKLLAREFDSRLHLVHVVDDDQAQLIVQVERDASTKLLEELTHTLEEIDAVKCDFRVVLGRPPSGITQAAQDVDAGLIVIGPHRRQLLRYILVGTTADIAETICATADELSADLIVVGTCGRSAIVRALLGSVTGGVLRNSERDVLAIPPLTSGVES